MARKKAEKYTGGGSGFNGNGLESPEIPDFPVPNGGPAFTGAR